MSRPREFHGATSRRGKRAPEYHTWIGMVARCYSKGATSYRYYGARGVEVCNRWRTSYLAFLSDVGHRPSPEHSLDRFPDKNGNYEPGNVRWATWTEQNRNMNKNRVLEINGEVRCVSEWAALVGISAYRIFNRLNRGWAPVDAVTKPLRTYKKEGENVKA